MSTLEHLMGVTFTTSQCPSCLWKRPCSLKRDPYKAFSGLEEKYLQLFLISSVHDSKTEARDLLMEEKPFRQIVSRDELLSFCSTDCDCGFGLWQSRRRSCGHVNTLSWFKLTILNHRYGGIAGSYPRNCITVAHKTSCCPVYHVNSSICWDTPARSFIRSW